MDVTDVTRKTEKCQKQSKRHHETHQICVNVEINPYRYLQALLFRGEERRHWSVWALTPYRVVVLFWKSFSSPTFNHYQMYITLTHSNCFIYIWEYLAHQGDGIQACDE